MTRLDPVLSQHLLQTGPESRRAEQLGFEQAWVSETVADPFAASATALLATDRLRVGTAVSVAFARSPFVVAQSAWELSRASGGRFTLGLGTQVKAHAERRLSVAWSPPVARMADYVRALRSIWDAFQHGTRLDHRGEFYQHTLLTDHFDPGPVDHPDIPVYLSGVNTRIAELVGEVGDGLLAHPLHTRAYLEDTILASVGEGAARADRAAGAIDLIVPVWVVSGDDEQEREASYVAVRTAIGTFASTTAYRPVLDSCGWGDLQPRLNEAMKDGGPARAGAAVPDELVRTIAVVADPDQVGAALDQRLGGVASAAMIYAPVPTALQGQHLARAMVRR